MHRHGFSLICSVKGRHFSWQKRTILVPIHVLRNKLRSLKKQNVRRERLGRFRSRNHFSDGVHFTDHALRININEDIYTHWNWFIAIITTRTSKTRVIIGDHFEEKFRWHLLLLSRNLLLPGAKWDSNGEKSQSKMSRLVSSDPLGKVSTRCFHVSRLEELSHYLNFVLERVDVHICVRPGVKFSSTRQKRIRPVSTDSLCKQRILVSTDMPTWGSRHARTR